MINKRGSSWEIVIFVGIALVIGVLLLLQFTGQINLFGKISGGSSNNNLQVIQTQCQTACATNTVYDWCTTARALVINNKPNVTTSCYKLVTNKTIQHWNLGISSCPSITCP